MKIRKFEARTLKEALFLVKKEMGSEAIVLSIKEYKKTFGLAGEKSVEVTAVDHLEKRELKNSSHKGSFTTLMEEEKQKESREGFLSLQKELHFLKSHLKSYKEQKTDFHSESSKLVQKAFEQMISSGVKPEYSFEIIKFIEANTPRHVNI